MSVPATVNTPVHKDNDEIPDLESGELLVTRVDSDSNNPHAPIQSATSEIQPFAFVATTLRDCKKVVEVDFVAVSKLTPQERYDTAYACVCGGYANPIISEFVRDTIVALRLTEEEMRFIEFCKHACYDVLLRVATRPPAFKDVTLRHGWWRRRLKKHITP